MDFNFSLEHINEAGLIMLLGMSGIFIVLGIIYLVSLALQKMFPGK